MDVKIDAGLNLHVSTWLRSIRWNGEPELLSELQPDFRGAVNSSQVAAHIPTGYSELDQLLGGGLVPGELTVLAARPAMGKTTLAARMIKHAALSEIESSVLLFSRELSGSLFARRLLLTSVEIPCERWEDKSLSECENLRIARARALLNSAPIFIDDSVGDCTAFVERTLSLHQHHAMRLIVFDYLQLLNYASMQSLGRIVETMAILKGLKEMALTLNLPVLVLSQMGRSYSSQKATLSQLDQLRDFVPQDPSLDVVMLFHRSDYYARAELKESIAQMQVVKNAHGSCGGVELPWS